jgi:hypothetical protein
MADDVANLLDALAIHGTRMRACHSRRWMSVTFHWPAGLQSRRVS